MRQQGGLIAATFAMAAMLAAPVALLSQAADATPQRTPWGDPDLGGIWTSSTYTPLERPDNLADRAFFSEDELSELNQLVTQDGVDPLRARRVLAAGSEAERKELMRQPSTDIHYDNALWLTEEQKRRFSNRRTSLIVDPPNGKIPPLLPEAERRQTERRQATRPPHAFDSHETRPLAERCLVWRHEGPPMLPASYNDLIQIFQTQDHVVFLQEMNNNGPRIIPLDGRPKLPASIREWPGESRGRWEGDTLVVETSNFNGRVPFRGSSEELQVVERFTRLDQTILYQFTVKDTTTWAQSWSAEFPLMKREGPLYEYACHEGNYDLGYILEVARNLER